MSSDTAISVSDVSKHYLMFEKPDDRLKQMIVPKLRHLLGLPPKSYFTDFAATNDISFEVKRGETVGIIGRNGSGKSTLLQMVCGTLEPSAGKIKVNGRIAALLELGSGFNPEFTGRENVFLNAAVLGLSREETEARYDRIAEFADIGIFIDQPVKTYSSGMAVRLAFAVATNVDPDILIVDEALAVGDEAFQRKCFARIEEIKERGGTILFVSHGAQTIIQLCDRAILLDRGEKILEGRPKNVVNEYQRFLNLTGEDAERARERIKTLDGWSDPDADVGQGMPLPEGAAPGKDETTTAWLDPKLVSKSKVEYEPKGATISNVRIETGAGTPVNHLVLNEDYMVCYDVQFDADLENVGVAMLVKTIHGVELAGQRANDYDTGMVVQSGDSFSVTLPFRCSFLPGIYTSNVGVFTRVGQALDIRHRILDAIIFIVDPLPPGYSRQGIVDIYPGNEPVTIEKISSRQAVLSHSGN